MVTAEERDYLWRTYAKDTRARINLGIRRRLAPLMDNDRRKIELMNALLLSMPGTPVLYYGDEIGMGDNYYLGDRDGVRTPMQWSADRNGGFCRANPQALYLPPIMDPVYGFQAVNVEAQQNEPSSLLNWTRRMIGVRKQHKAFGRGTLTLPLSAQPQDPRLFRGYEDERILCVANLSRQAQAVELDLSEFTRRGADRADRRRRLPADRRPALSADAAGLRLLLVPARRRGRGAALARRRPPSRCRNSSRSRRRAGGSTRALDGRERQQLERYALPEFLAAPALVRRQERRDRARSSAAPLGAIPGDAEPARHRRRRDRRRASSAISCRSRVLWGEENLRFGAPKLSYTLAKVRHGPKLGALIDAAYDERFIRDLIARDARAASELPAADGKLALRVRPKRSARSTSTARSAAVGGEQSNVSLRRRRRGDAEDLPAAPRRRAAGDRGGALPDRGRRVPEHAGLSRQRRVRAGRAASRSRSPRSSPSCATRATPGASIARRARAPPRRVRAPAALDARRRGRGAAPTFAYPLDLAARRSAGARPSCMPRFATPTDDPAFAAEPVSADDVDRWVDAATRRGASARFAMLRARDRGLPDEARPKSPRCSMRARRSSQRLEALRGLGAVRPEDPHPRRLSTSARCWSRRTT